MGYFPNGTEGELYEAEYCDRCVHQDDPCAVWLLHMLHNSDECNNDKSMLHVLIPKNGIRNEQCAMFHQKTTADANDPLAYLEATHAH